MTSDWIAIILKLAALQAFILTFFLLQKKNRLPGTPFLAAGILILGLNCWLQSAESIGFYITVPHLIRLDWGFNLLIFPLFFLFTQAYFKGQAAHKQDLWHFAPYVIHLLFMQTFLWKSGEEKIQILDFFGVNPSKGIDVYSVYYYAIHLEAA